MSVNIGRDHRKYAADNSDVAPPVDHPPHRAAAFAAEQ
jgi:hypothetical protein